MYGIKVCNVPVGTDEFVDVYLCDKMDDIKEKKYWRVKELLDFLKTSLIKVIPPCY